MRIRIEVGLPFVSVTLTHGERDLELDRVLLDTGSARCVFAVDRLQIIDVQYEPQDAVHRIRGVGGTEFVFTKRVDRLALGELRADDFEIEAGAVDYGIDLQGIVGLDFLIQVGAVIDLASLEVRQEVSSP